MPDLDPKGVPPLSPLGGGAVMPDTWIREMAMHHGMIQPFISAQRGFGEISYGVSSYGYDVRLGDRFKIFTNVHNTIVDPKAFDEKSMVDHIGSTCVIPPNSFVLGMSMEKIRVPKDVLVLCLGKSTYARCGIIVNVTPLEPGWEGHITLEFSNTTPLPAKLYAREGACQLVFLKGHGPCEVNYAARAGKYMHQEGIVTPRVSGWEDVALPARLELMVEEGE